MNVGFVGRLLRRSAIGAVPVAGATFVGLVHRRDRRSITSDPEWTELNRPLQGRVVSVNSDDGTVLHVEVFGPEDAPPIVLVHGWTMAIKFWHHQIRDLSRDHRVIAYDQRGHGRSSAPGRGAYSTEALANDLDAVLTATLRRGERCVAVGHSMGGMTLVAWAGHHRDSVEERLAGAVLVDTGMGDLITELLLFPTERARRLQRVLVGRAAVLPVRLPKTSTPVSLRLVHWIALGPGASAAQVAFSERIAALCPAPVRAGFGRMFGTLDLALNVPHLTVPTAVVVGGADRLTPPSHSRRIAAALPRCVGLTEIPGVGHMAPIEAPEAVNRTIRDLACAHSRTLGAQAASIATAEERPGIPVRRRSRRAARRV